MKQEKFYLEISKVFGGTKPSYGQMPCSMPTTHNMKIFGTNQPNQIQMVRPMNHNMKIFGTSNPNQTQMVPRLIPASHNQKIFGTSNPDHSGFKGYGN